MFDKIYDKYIDSDNSNTTYNMNFMKSGLLNNS